MSFSEFLSRVKAYWLVVVLVMAAVLAATTAYLNSQTPTYSAQSTVFVATQGGSTVQELQQGLNFTQGRVATYATLVTTPLVLEQVVDELDLDTTPGQLAEHVEALSPELTSLVEISVSYTDPELAAAIANAAAESLIDTVAEIEDTVSVVQDDGVTEEVLSPLRLTVVKEATVPNNPTSPKRTTTLLLGFIGGAAIAVATVALIAVVDTRIRGARDVRRVTGAPLLARIAHGWLPSRLMFWRPAGLVMRNHASSRRAESFRALRTNVQSLAAAGSNSFAVTSSVKREARTATTLNLAAALAEVGARVVVVDANLRAPKVAAALGLPAEVGLTDVLLGRVPQEKAMQTLSWEGGDGEPLELHVIPAGAKVGNRSALVAFPQMDLLVRELESNYDFVLFDTPAVLSATDAAVVAKQVGSTIVVVTTARTKRGALAEAIESLEQAGGHIAGIALMLPLLPSMVDNDVTPVVDRDATPERLDLDGIDSDEAAPARRTSPPAK